MMFGMLIHKMKMSVSVEKRKKVSERWMDYGYDVEERRRTMMQISWDLVVFGKSPMYSASDDVPDLSGLPLRMRSCASTGMSPDDAVIFCLIV